MKNKQCSRSKYKTSSPQTAPNELIEGSLWEVARAGGKMMAESQTAESLTVEA